MDDDNSRSELYDQCSGLVPLKQYVYIFLGLAFLWSLLATYLVYYVPRRHALTKAYLTQGQVVIGDVYYNRKKRAIGALSSYGSAIYPHPDDATGRSRQNRILSLEQLGVSQPTVRLHEHQLRALGVGAELLGNLRNIPTQNRTQVGIYNGRIPA